ncbi:MAG: hypothetical protein EZS28_010814 [Streblomastix strix]|uniref:Uncharacterized protein n=1 Tax=Streblomastix strix TaxID=222440 RepID=A0A5J4WFB4_9EUKA|nr:MAG: hypothetical protein EZS28_010814 [Streblomastix strix]
MANYQNGPQAVEYRSQNLICSVSVYGYYEAVVISGAIILAAPATAVQSARLICNANLRAGIVIYQLTQQIYTIEHIRPLLALNKAREYLYPSLVN